MKWFDYVGLWLIEHPVINGLLIVLFLVIYIWVIYIEDKWGD